MNHIRVFKLTICTLLAISTLSLLNIVSITSFAETNQKLDLHKYTESEINSAREQTIYENASITLLRDICFGWCPNYYLEVLDNGTVFYRGIGYVNVTGERTSRIDPATVSDLISEFYSNGFFNLSSKYGYENAICTITNQANVVISISVNDTSKSVSDYQGCIVPSQLRYLEGRIDEIANSSQWTKPRSEVSLQQEFNQNFESSGDN